MARKRGLSIDFSAFAELAEELDNMGADLQKVFTDVMEQEGEDVQADTIAALDAAHLPAHGIYSLGDTKDSVDEFPKVTWEGSIGELPLGFDKTKYGAGTWLITGTPKMQPDYELQRIYSQKKYESDLKKHIMEDLNEEIRSRVGG